MLKFDSHFGLSPVALGWEFIVNLNSSIAGLCCGSINEPTNLWGTFKVLWRKQVCVV